MAAKVEWYRGLIVTREAGRMVFGVRYTMSGLVIEPYPRWRWTRRWVELAVAAVVLCAVASVTKVPRPVTLTCFAAWLLARFVVSRVLPWLATTVVLDDEHLWVDQPRLLSRRILLRRADVARVVADGSRVLARDASARSTPIVTAGLTPHMAAAIAELLDDAIAAARDGAG